MIHVEHLTKQYPGTLAVDDVSFSVDRGEIVGFLGPNGAGKSTTMRVLAGYLPATGGTVRVAGHDVERNSLEVRRHIGYLPENCPLYPEMRVVEYLNFRAKLKGVPGKQRPSRVGQVLEQCGLEAVKRRPIGQLSKGYRQRVGIADALVHAPDLLILDEPTIGLDPNQIRQVRGLISQLAAQHTLLVSTHILSEVEATCNRVIVINGGKVVESGTLAELREKWCPDTTVVAEIQAPAVEVAQHLQSLSFVRKVLTRHEAGWTHCRLSFRGRHDARGDLFRLAVARRWMLRELRLEERSLEDMFAQMTGAEVEQPEVAAREGGRA